jgi:hypothetical protein
LESSEFRGFELGRAGKSLFLHTNVSGHSFGAKGGILGRTWEGAEEELGEAVETAGEEVGEEVSSKVDRESLP